MCMEIKVEALDDIWNHRFVYIKFEDIEEL